MSHTPGPWEWDGDVCDYDREQYARWLRSGVDRILTGEIMCLNPDDALLIKYAPDLLGVLKLILPLAKGYRPKNQTMTEATTCASWIHLAEEIIAKAEGKS